MEFSSIGIQLSVDGTVVRGVKDVPDSGGAPNTIAVTDLSDTYTRYISGVQEQGELEFTANYLAEEYSRLNNLDGIVPFAITYPDGTNPVTGTGSVHVYRNGAGVDEVLEYTITIVRNS